MSDKIERTELEQEDLFQKKLQELLEKGKTTKKIPSRLLIETLDFLDADEQTTEQMYDALEAAGMEIDVDDVLEIIGKADDLEPTSEQLSQEEEKEMVDTEAISEGLALTDPVRMYLKEIGRVALLTQDSSQDGKEGK